MWNNCFVHLLLVSGLVFVQRCVGITKPTSVKLIDNGYTGVVIAIHHEEPENEKLINEIKAMIISASSYLYRATRHRAYFEEVMILLPDTWNDKAEYESPRNSTFEGADVIIAEMNPRYPSEPGTPSEPYTKHYEGCGQRAGHIHITSKFLVHPETTHHYGDKGRNFVHEWAHYRWGLFDEYPNRFDDPSADLESFYYSDTNKIFEPIRCTRGYEAYNLVYREESESYDTCNGNEKDGYENGCVSIPSPKQDYVTASILSGELSIDEIVDFCDDDDHNEEAPNKHNRLCEGKSAWSIMNNHEDFKDEHNTPRENIDVTPRFILARVKDIRVVLVLDSSGSMGEFNRIEKLSSTSQEFLLNIAVDGSSIGIVDFDSAGRPVSGLTLIDSQETREELANKIQTKAQGGTCIGSGLNEALEILSENDQSPAGGLILLVTDGLDDCTEKTEILRESLVTQSVVVDAVAFSNEADEKLISLTESTGGKFYLQTDDPGSTGLHDAYVGTMVSGVKEGDRRIEIHRDLSYYAVNESKSYGVFIDETIGNETTFGFSYLVDSRSDVLDIRVTSPSEKHYMSDYHGYTEDKQFKTIHVKFETAEPGAWSFRVTNRHFSGHEVFSNVYTYPSQKGVDPIIATSELSGSVTDFANGGKLTALAEVRQGFYPVIRADVYAIIERPPDENEKIYFPVELQLLDDGTGADITKDDGIYSRWFTDYTGIGYYGIKINVESNAETIILDGSSPIPYSYTLASADPEELLKGNLPTIDGTPIYIRGMPIPEPRGSQSPNFTRAISGGSSQVPETPEGWEPGDDIFAPSRITDLVVTSAHYQNGTVVLEFTAPGDDFDSGRASYYIIRMSGSTTELRNSYSSIAPIPDAHILQGNTSSCGEFGARELFVISVAVPTNQTVVSYAFAVHAVDESENEGEMSNLAQATLRAYIPPPMTTAPTTVPTTPGALPTTVVPTTAKPSEVFPVWAIVIIVLVSFIVVGVIVSVLGFIPWYIHRHRDQSKTRSEMKQPTLPRMICTPEQVRTRDSDPKRFLGQYF